MVALSRKLPATTLVQDYTASLSNVEPVVVILKIYDNISTI